MLSQAGWCRWSSRVVGWSVTGKGKRYRVGIDAGVPAARITHCERRNATARSLLPEGCPIVFPEGSFWMGATRGGSGNACYPPVSSVRIEARIQGGAPVTGSGVSIGTAEPRPFLQLLEAEGVRKNRPYYPSGPYNG